ncbi:MAG: ErfK/YbiS/YcfS/YnhG family protein [Candidatus Woesebacteria bacterium GW2011_GWA1_37_7]|uniref:ErfK/YbiS/YcfS/YnhG family protein n=1 Tax=Candidatus Woesebacteria bacterium GW2011_GWA1_37_7 TaxID=1618545 RepID=A0A0G0HEN1_9BACT|nr:MAG: ErfK/YbiS/YcfS/YnhG family protein [Candidatus Woesebacteria bacterium GW2011_GWA1_37_7]
MKNLLFVVSCALIILTAFTIIRESGTKKVEFDKQSYLGCEVNDLSGLLNYSDNIAIFEGKELSIPQLAFEEREFKVLSLSTEERWIEVDLSEQKLKAWEGGSLFLETPVSTGLPWWPTPKGEFRIWIKLRATRMEGGSGKYYYNLPNVPYVMFFENESVPGWRGYGLHGTYWHNSFGTPRSHGCVNLPTNIAKELYFWTTPTLPEGKGVVYASAENLGTRIVIHD